jgi:hypothetical protein
VTKRNQETVVVPWRQPHVLALAAVALFVLSLLVLARSPLALGIVLEHLLIDGALILIWLASAWGWGQMLLRAIRANVTENRDALMFTSAIALGLGILSLLILLGGLLGLTGRASAMLVLLPGFAFAIVRIVRVLRTRSIPRSTEALDWLWLLLVPTFALCTIAALVPAGILWGDEPNGYDVVEYHLQVPREWYELGRITPLTHNVFSYFPMNVETHYLLAMQLRGGPWAGQFLAQFMHVAMTGLTVLAVYAVARAPSESKVLSILAALLVGVLPWSTLLAPVAYVEGGLLLFGTLSVGWFFIACKQERQSDAPRSSILAGAFAGFACGVKLTAVPMIVIALPLVALLMRCSWRVIAMFLVVAMLTLSPWLVRNFVWAHNPVFPEATSIFGKAHWTDDQVQRWQRANHHPRPDQQTLPGRVRELKDQFVADPRYGFALLPVSLVVGAMGWRSNLSRALLALLVLMVGFWLFFTHLQSRFLILTIPVMAMLMGLAPPGRVGISLACAAVVVASACTWAVLPAKLAAWMDVLGIEQLPGPEGVRDDQTLVLVGDARAFLDARPMSRLRYRTVFDVDAAAASSIIDAWAPRRPANDVLLIDPNELRRFARTYWGIPPLPREYEGRTEPFLVADHPRP